MNIFLYIIIFIIGILFGSFLTLATHRIPLNQDITHKRSYCPKCNHKLTFLDMIPILSYIFLGGKCRYCKAKINPRYFIIEILCGIAFCILAWALGINIYTLTLLQGIEFGIGVLYIVFLFLIAAIDKEYKKIDKRVLIYGTSIAVINMAYQYWLCIMESAKYNIYRSILYIVAILILTVLNIINTRKNSKSDYIIDTLIITVIMSLFTYEITTILTVICTLLIISIKLLIHKIINKRKKYNKKMPIILYMAISNAIILLITFFYTLGI